MAAPRQLVIPTAQSPRLGGQSLPQASSGGVPNLDMSAMNQGFQMAARAFMNRARKDRNEAEAENDWMERIRGQYGDKALANVDSSQSDNFNRGQVAATVTNIQQDQADVRKQAEKQLRFFDQLEGEKAGSNWEYGVDEQGNPVPLDYNMDKSPEWNQAFMVAAGNNTAAKLRIGLENNFNRIQIEHSGDTNAQLRLMQEALDAGLENIPDQWKSKFRTAGEAEIQRRYSHVTQSEMKAAKRLVIVESNDFIKQSLDRATQLVRIGQSAESEVAEIASHINDLVKNGAMSQDMAITRMAEIDDALYIEGVGGQLVRHAQNGVIDPDTIRRMGVALQTGGSEEVELVLQGPVTEDDEDGLLTQLFRTDDIVKRFPNETELRGIGADLIQSANLVRSEINANAKQQKFQDWMGNPEVTGPMPGDLQGFFEETLNNMVSQGGFIIDDNDDGARVKTMFGMMKRAQYVPPDIQREMLTQVRMGNEPTYNMIMDGFHFLSDGLEGKALLERMSEEVADEMRILLEVHVATGGNMDEVRDFANREPNETISFFQGEYTQQTGKRLGTQFREQYLKATEVLPSPKMMSVFERQYQLRRIRGINPEAAYERAYAAATEQFEVGAIFREGIAHTRNSDVLADPPGFEPELNPVRQEEIRGPGGMGDRGGGAYRSWIESYTRKVISDMVDSGALGLSLDDLGYLEGAIENDSQDLLGSTLFLSPTNRNLSTPDFEVWMRLDSGEERRVTHSDGRPVHINPAVAKTRWGHISKAQDAWKGLEAARNTKVENIRRKYESNKWQARNRSTVDLEDYKEYVRKNAASNDSLFEKQADEVREDFKRQQERVIENLDRVLPDDKIKADDLWNFGPDGRPEGEKFGGGQSSMMFTPGAGGEAVAMAAVSAIDAIIPDGTNGAFLMNIAATESNFGLNKAAFRERGDVGIMQINEHGAYPEIQRRIREGGKIAKAAAAIDAAYGTNLGEAELTDLNKPIYSAAYARLYLLTDPRPNPRDITGQAMMWKEMYNTSEGKGSPSHFIQKAKYSPSDMVADGPVEGSYATSLKPFLNADKATGHLNFAPRFGDRLGQFLRDAKKAGHDISIFSGYRDPAYQAKIISRNWKKYAPASLLPKWKADVKEFGPIQAGKKWRPYLKSRGMTQNIGMPGGSPHQHGVAADLDYKGNKKAKRWAHDNARRYRLNFRLENEDWHIELQGQQA